MWSICQTLHEPSKPKFSHIVSMPLVLNRRQLLMCDPNCSISFCIIFEDVDFVTWSLTFSQSENNWSKWIAFYLKTTWVYSIAVYNEAVIPQRPRRGALYRPAWMPWPLCKPCSTLRCWQLILYLFILLILFLSFFFFWWHINYPADAICSDDVLSI